ncbi:MAG: thioredoxin domain-containing protein [Gordonia sp. (in: high G+C Gram-positive bacteria)]
MSQKPVIDPMAAERRRSLIIKIVATLALVALAAFIVIVIVVKNKDDSKTGGSATPTVVTSDGAFRITTAALGTTPPAVVTAIEDFQCPACRSFESSYSEVLAKLAQNPKVAVDYKPIAFLDRMSTDDYSSRAANASMCVAEATAKKGADGKQDFGIWLKYHNLLYGNQPAEGGAGLTNDKLFSLAKEAGASGVKDCINNGQFDKWVKSQTAKVTSGDFQGTPTVLINGTQYQVPQQPDPAGFEAQVLAAAEKK